MHRFLVIVLLVFLKNTILQTSHLVNILEKETNFFHKINSQLHSLTNRIFRSLNLKKELTRTSKFQRLVMMHHDLNILAEVYSQIFKYIQNKTSTTAYGNNTTSLEKLFEVVLNEEIRHSQSDSLKVFTNNTKTSNLKAYEIMDDEFTGVVNEIVRKVKKLSVGELFQISNETHQSKQDKITFRNKNHDIKIWHEPTSTEDIVTNNTRRIYKGKNTKIKNYPFLASVHVMHDFVCAGSIISKDLIITAATCFQIAHNNKLYHKNPRSMFIRVGSDFTKHSGELIPITQIHFHPAFDPVTLKNNLVIVRVMKRLRFKKRKIKRIKIGDIDDSTDEVTVLGWGAKDAKHDKSHTEKLSVAKLDIYNSKDCTEMYSRYYVTNKNFCAGFESRGGGACNGDVGGPAIVSGELVGVISFGPLVCGMSDAPTVFTRVGYYADWIDDIISQKPQLRNFKIVNTTSKKPAIAFPMPPLLTTSRPAQQMTDIPNFITTTTEVTYPDEVVILKDILQEIVLSNNSIIDYILYGDAIHDEHEAKNILSTTKKVDVHHHPLVNKSIFMIERNSNSDSMKTVPLKRDGSESYDEADTELKVIETLTRFTQPLKDDTKLTKAYIKSDVEGTVIKHNKTSTSNFKEYNNSLDMDDDNKTDLNDLSSYYEDGISIEAIKPIKSRIDNFFDRKTTLNSTTLKSIKLEDYKNIMFNVNLKKEGRSILRLPDNKIKDFKQNVQKNFKYDKHIKRVELRREGINKAGRYKTVKTTERGPLAVVMAISDEGFNYGDMRVDNYFVTKNKNKDYSKEPMRWRYRSRD